MATYAELLTATENTALFNKVRVAVTIAADKIRTETPPPTNHDKRLEWAKLVFEGPDAQAKKIKAVPIT